MKRASVGAAIFLAALTAASAFDFKDFFRTTSSTTNSSSASSGGLAALSQDEIVRGLKEALGRGVQQAVTNLGKDGGFLNNLNVKIPMPPQLSQIERGLRMLKQDKYADEFVATMNHAAERAVPEAVPVVTDALAGMTMEDARNILNGPEDAATQYFKKTTSARLTEKFKPIVAKATAQTGVTSAYKNLMAKAGSMATFLNKDATDIDGYVTQKGLDGLFVMMAQEEKTIRQNPAARATDLLKKVFGGVKAQ